MVAYEVQDTVKDDAVQFLIEGDFEFGGVFADTVYADIYFGLDLPISLGEREGDNIGVVVMPEKVLIDTQQVVIRAEDVAHTERLFCFFLKG